MLKKTIIVAIPSLLGSVAGNLAYHLIDSYHEAQQLEADALPPTKVIGANWVPQSTLAATLLATRTEQRPGLVGFLLAMALSLVAVAATGRQAVPATPSTIISQ